MAHEVKTHHNLNYASIWADMSSSPTSIAPNDNLTRKLANLNVSSLHLPGACTDPQLEAASLKNMAQRRAGGVGRWREHTHKTHESQACCRREGGSGGALRCCGVSKTERMKALLQVAHACGELFCCDVSQDVHLGYPRSVFEAVREAGRLKDHDRRSLTGEAMAPPVVALLLVVLPNRCAMNAD